MDEQAGRLKRRGPAADAWLRWFWLWDGYFAVAYVAISTLVLFEDDTSGTRKVAAVTVLTVMAVWYVAYGRAVITERVTTPRRRGRIFISGVVVLLVAAVAFEGSASFALFAVCPLVFMSLELKAAIPVIIVINLLPPLGVLIQDGATTMFTVLGPATLFTIVFALAIGIWIHRILTQSEDRRVLIKELEESREEIGRLSREAGVATERARLAAEIHDTLAQGFTSLVTLVQAAESELDGDRDKARRHLELAARTARENLDEARALVAGLMPSALGTGSLDEAIQRQLEGLTEETSIKASYRVDGDSAALPTVLEVVLLRAVQESLTNVRKHSGASEVSIGLGVNGSAATLRVSDNGSGFDPAQVSDGFGLRGMQARATHVGGTLNVHSGADGTTVELEVPR